MNSPLSTTKVTKLCDRFISCLLKSSTLTVKDPEITFYKFPTDRSVFGGGYPVFTS